MAESMKNLRERVEREGIDSKTRSMIKRRIWTREKRIEDIEGEVSWYLDLLRKHDKKRSDIAIIG
jgi:hypothetical protein